MWRAGHWVAGVTDLASREGCSLEASANESRPLLHPHHSDRDFQLSDVLLQWPLQEILNVEINT